ncbi:3'-5' exoribonuclease [Candidatus Comchoanobacter bicostacola]|uniref:3'-5' exoribonuclease n=1 Tax=Candidatus Comchoanobacter bicostacola TaxID=2919598 RepID=A0ABY5DKI5_9GAMM|nr:exonuclease domain-containing protein [Candidatus Comchoanobacter bicostacola]UTC24503.1 3'-5' exoribonuclease [Candidatus Comchoanobacter bicostacola]
MKYTIDRRFKGLLPVVIDIETAGFDPNENALLEVAAVFMNYDEGILQPIHIFHEHVIPEPGLELDEAALEFTQIIPDHPFRMAKPEAEVIQLLNEEISKYMDFLGCSRSVLVGHNGQFDLSFLQAAAERHQLPLQLHRFLVMDTATLSAALLGETVLAKAVRKARLPFDDAQAHGALYDATITSELFSKLIQQADASRIRSGSGRSSG